MRAETAEIQREDAGRLLVPRGMSENAGLTEEQVACCIYETIFVDDWHSVCGIERECYLNAARAVLKLLLTPLGDSFMTAWETRHEEQR